MCVVQTMPHHRVVNRISGQGANTIKDLKTQILDLVIVFLYISCGRCKRGLTRTRKAPSFSPGMSTHVTFHSILCMVQSLTDCNIVRATKYLVDVSESIRNVLD